MTLIQQTFKKKISQGASEKNCRFFSQLVSSPIILRISLAYQFLVQKKNSNSPGPSAPTSGTKPDSGIPAPPVVRKKKRTKRQVSILYPGGTLGAPGKLSPLGARQMPKTNTRTRSIHNGFFWQHDIYANRSIWTFRPF